MANFLENSAPVTRTTSEALRALTDDAHTRRMKLQPVEQPGRTGSPQLGDVYFLSIEAPVACIEWAVVDSDAQDDFYRIAAIDIGTLVGTCDVTVAVEPMKAQMIIRGRYSLWVQGEILVDGRRTGWIDLDEVGAGTRACLERAATGSTSEIDDDSDYVGWIREIVLPAHRALRAKISRAHVGPSYTALGSMWTRVAALLFLGLGMFLVGRETRVELSAGNQDQVLGSNVPLVWLSPMTMRGEPNHLTQTENNDVFVLLWPPPDTAPHSSYRFEFYSASSLEPVLTLPYLVSNRPGEELNVILNHEQFPHGEYLIRIHGLDAEPPELIDEQRFVVNSTSKDSLAVDLNRN